MKLTVTGQFVKKSSIIRKRELDDFSEEFDVELKSYGETLALIRYKLLPERLKAEESNFIVVRTCQFDEKSLAHFPVAEKKPLGANPSKDFDPKTGRPFSEPVPTSVNNDDSELPKPRNKKSKEA